ncbi:MAG TPA: 16S rRNA (guanine(527)-N(7))-methyltransferase RsmG [Bacteroidota bacterium]|nr:16S rRNA (guanine(527)-N(7))-methyltransferase RsmG [Bacteroidota bacterium]
MVEKALWLKAVFGKNGMELTAEQVSQLSEYVRLLLEWNQKVNLISRKDEENIWERHILHSAALVLLFDFPAGSKVIDIGTGGGLPGIPLKIFRPDLELLLLDSTKKKIDAVSAMLSSLELQNISAVWGRAEELATLPQHREQYHIAVARAVAQLPELIKWAEPFLVEKSQRNIVSSENKIALSLPTLLALKGGDVSKEIELAKRKFRTFDIQEYALQFEGAEPLEENQKKVVVVNYLRG